ncbi:MAG: class beta-lactamase-related serine hydrolase [Sphingobacteriales bacterium]|nr:class beta-lactamase-related serine hydrolase [Sphingobacteriales bacterium]
MTKTKISLLLLPFLFASVTLFAQPKAFLLSTPEEEGIPSESINALVNSLEKDIHSVHSFTLLRHGKLVAQGWWNPYKRENPHTLWSLSKSFTSAAIGFAVQEKLLNINDRVISFFPNDLPENPSDNLKNMRVKDLLTMSTGQRNDAFGPMAIPKDNNPVKAFLALPVEQKPGSLFIYNTGATYMLSAIIQKVTGKKLLDYLQPRLFEPLDIKNPQWGEGSGINWGGFGLAITTESIAKFGQLYLQKGVWNGKQLLSEEWINQSSSKQVSNGSDPLGHWDSGYGFQFWRNPKYGYRADGAFGQFCFILPEFDMVLAMTSGTNDTKGVMDIISDKFLTTLSKEKLKENPAALANLNNKMANLTISPAEGKAFSTVAKKVSGNTYLLENNEFGLKSITFSFDKKITNMLFATNNGNEEILSETGKWKLQETSIIGTIPPSTTKKIAVSSGWVSDDTFGLTIRYTESESMIKLRFKFEGNELTVDGDRNVNFGPTKLPIIKGSIKKK